MTDEQANCIRLRMILAAPYFRFPERPRLVEDLHVFEMPEALGFQLRGAVSTIVIRGSHAADAFRALIPQLDGTRTLEDLVSHPPESVPLSSLLKTLILLHSKGLLLGNGIARPEEFDPTLRRQELYWGRNLGLLQRSGTAAEVQHQIDHARVLIIGAGLFAANVYDLLGRSGVRSMRVVAWDDDGFLLETLRKLPPPLDAISFETTAVDPLLGCLERWGDELDLVVTATLHAAPSLFYAVNRFCSGRRLRWLRANIEGDALEMGPFVNPGETACYECMRMRQASAGSLSAEDYIYQQGIDRPRRAGQTPPRGESLAFTSLAGSLVATEVLRILTMIATPTLTNAARSISLLGGETLAHRVMPVPSCPSCHSRHGAFR